MPNSKESLPSRRVLKLSEKQIPLQRTLKVKLSYVEQEVPFMKDNILQEYEITLPRIATQQFWLTLQYYLDLNSISFLDKAQIVEYEVNSGNSSNPELVPSITNTKECCVKLAYCSFGLDETNIKVFD